MTIFAMLQIEMLNAGIGVGLIFVAIMIGLLMLVSSKGKGQAVKSNNEAIEPVKTSEPAAQEVSEEEVDDLELIAVITAALTAHIEEETQMTVEGLVVKSIRRINKSKWQNA